MSNYVAPFKVMAEMELVRRSGEVNTFNKNGVMSVAYELECHSLVVWLDELERHENDKYMNMLQDSVDLYGDLEEFPEHKLEEMDEKELQAQALTDEI
jgi:hypothetical protein